MQVRQVGNITLKQWASSTEFSTTTVYNVSDSKIFDVIDIGVSKPEVGDPITVRLSASFKKSFNNHKEILEIFKDFKGSFVLNQINTGRLSLKDKGSLGIAKQFVMCICKAEALPEGSFDFFIEELNQLIKKQQQERDQLVQEQEKKQEQKQVQDQKDKEKTITIADALINKLLESKCRFMFSAKTISFNSTPSEENLLAYAEKLRSAGLSVRIIKASSLLDGLVKIPATLELNDSPESIVEKLSTFPGLQPQQTQQPSVLRIAGTST